MGSILDVGVAGQPLSSPPLTDWQKAVRDVLGGSDVAVDARIDGIGGVAQLVGSVPSSTTANTQLTIQGTPLMWGGVTASGSSLLVARSGVYEVTCQGGWTSAAGGSTRMHWVWLNSGLGVTANWAQIGASATPSNTSGVGAVGSAAGYMRITQGDGFRVFGRQDSGAALTCQVTLTIRWLRD